MLLLQILNVPVNVMLPQDTVMKDQKIVNISFLNESFAKLKQAGVNGVLLDVWWGYAEPQPGVYMFNGYTQIAQLAKNVGLKLKLMINFHKCGANANDMTDIPIPHWALKIAQQEKYLPTDQWGYESDEMITPLADGLTGFPTSTSAKRTLIQCYSDFMIAFNNAMQTFINSKVVDEMYIGVGANGEARFPSFPIAKWKFPGIGAFQAWDPLMKKDLLANATAQKHNEWGEPPTDVGGYNSTPHDAQFFQSRYSSSFGKFFLQWYEDKMYDHVNLVLSKAKDAFRNVTLSVKLAGTYWWYGDASHAAEATSGYFNAIKSNAFDDYLELLTGYGTRADIPCFEMADAQFNESNSQSRPQELVKQAINSVKLLVGKMNGENTNIVYDVASFNQILSNIKLAKGYIDSFEFKRLTAELMTGANWANFGSFVQQAKNI